jgi:hypothetical protein
MQATEQRANKDQVQKAYKLFKELEISPKKLSEISGLDLMQLRKFTSGYTNGYGQLSEKTLARISLALVSEKIARKYEH